ncbi:MAG: beta-lactamase family protein [Chloroflexota bacterium]|nr:beta-lactamase family protein [Chloroflexota bacterium]
MDLATPLKSATKVIDRWLAYKVQADRLPGLSVGIVYKDRAIFSQGYGYADIEQKIPATPTTCYRIASFSKIFTAIAVLQLFEQEKLHLDDRVRRYLPWFTSKHDPRTGQITIRQLLTHTAGLDRDGDTPHWTDFQFPSLDQIQQHITAGAMTYAPAERWKYSNLGFTILGEVIKVASGMSYEAFVNKHIVKRLNLSHTAPAVTDDIGKHLALGYSRAIPGQERVAFPRIETRAMASATGFSSNVTDLCQFMLAQFEGHPRLLADASKREMRRIQWLREGSDSDWSLGFQTWKINERRIYGHGGSFQGYKSRFGIDIGRTIGVVILANAIDAPSQDLLDGALQIIDYLITRFEEFAPPSTRVENIERYEGNFRCIWEDVAVAAVNNGLLLYDPASTNPALDFHQLRYEKGDQFKMVHGDSFGNIGEPVRFECDDKGLARRMFVGPDPLERFE